MMALMELNGVRGDARLRDQVGRDIGCIRITLGLSCEEVANRAGLAPAVVNKMEMGRAISDREAERICAVLGFSYFDMITDAKSRISQRRR